MSYCYIPSSFNYSCFFLQKLQVFLFDHALVLTRNATRDDKLTYQVYRQPLPLKTMIVETEEGGKLSGSLRGGILSSDKGTVEFHMCFSFLYIFVSSKLMYVKKSSENSSHEQIIESQAVSQLKDGSGRLLSVSQ